MKENELTVLKVEPGKAPEEVTIPNTLDAMQQMVGGYIEVVYLEDACLVCNEDGKLIGLDGNRRVGNDIIAGTFFLVGDQGDGVQLASGDEAEDFPAAAAVCAAGLEGQIFAVHIRQG